MRRRQKCRQKQLGGERTLLATANATSRKGQGLIAQKANLQKKMPHAPQTEETEVCFAQNKAQTTRLPASKRRNGKTRNRGVYRRLTKQRRQKRHAKRRYCKAYGATPTSVRTTVGQTEALLPFIRPVKEGQLLQVLCGADRKSKTI